MDPRFDTSKDPRFRRVPRSVRRVKVDKRFAHMFDDKRFVETPKVDPRGQRLRSESAKNKLREFYELADGDNSIQPGMEADLAPEHISPKKQRRRKSRKGEESASTPLDPDGVEESAEVLDGAEGDDSEGEDDHCAEESSDDSDEDSSEDEEDEREEGDGLIWEATDHDAPRGDATARLAIMGCDWDHVSAADVIVLLRTYLVSKDAVKVGARGGSVNKVVVYPSDYGIEQLAKEAEAGPQGFSETASDAVGDDDEKRATELMRRYQLQRTKYYYAVADCDSAATASTLYDQLDGLEAAGITPGTLDLRFVPEDMEFPHKPITEATQTPKQYQGPALERASALGHTKVQCSWDEAPAHRKRDLMRKRYTPQELEQMDLDAYLASTSEEDDGSGAENLKSLVSGLCDLDDSGDENLRDVDDHKQPEEGDMEMTFNLSAEKMEDELMEKASQQAPKQGGRGKVHTLDAEKPKSTWEAYLEKRKEKRREKRVKAKEERQARKTGATATEATTGEAEEAETQGAGEEDLELLAMEDEQDAGRGFNVRGKLRTAAKRAAKDSGGGDFKVDVNDPRIANVFGNADFEIDPTNPEFRPSEGMQAVLKKKRDRKVKARAAAAPAPAALDASSVKEQANAGSHDSAVRDQNSKNGASALGGLQLFATKKRNVGTDVAPDSKGSRASNVEGAGSGGSTDSIASKRKKRVRTAGEPQGAPEVPKGTKKRKKSQRAV